MTQQEWENATEAERTEEYERCKDPVYMYNTYWRNGDGTKVSPITKEQWDELNVYANNYRKNRYVRRPIQPLLAEDSYLPDYFKPSSQ